MVTALSPACQEPQDPTDKPIKLTRADINYQAINERALEHIDAIFERWLPDGEYVGKEYRPLNPKRDDTETGSFSINTESGVWCDFAGGDDDKGGDLVSLIAYLEGCSQSDAAKKLVDFLATLDGPTKTPPQAKAKGKKTKIQGWTPIIPVPVNAPARLDSHFKHGALSKAWPYKTAEGEVVGYICRFDPPGGRKEILPLTFCQDQVGNMAWRWLGLPEPRPLYNRDQLATRPDAPVLVCEGEKAADAAAQLFPDHVCVTSSNGAKSAGKTDWGPLKGRVVSIWPDNDQPGRDHAKAITTILREMDATAEVSIMKPITQTPGRNEAGEPVLEDGFTPPDGWDAADAVEAGWTADHVRLLGEDAFGPYRADTTIRIGDFVVRDSGVFAIGTDPSGQPYEVLVSSRIDVVALSRDAHNQNWGLLLEFKDADGVLHTWCMPKEVLAGGNGYRAQLLSMGMDIATTGQKDRLAEYLQAYKPSARALSVSQPGWHGPVFVLPSRIIGKTQEIVALQTSDPAGANIFKQKGTLAGWQEQVAVLCQGNSRLVLAVCAALTGPVLHLLHKESGGFHLVGGSSTGKTTSLEVAASVWGGRDFVRTWRTTDNGLEAVATRHNDTLLILDELSQVDTDKAGEVAYMLGNGQGKGRANRSGLARAVTSWRLIYLSTGEVSLADHLSSGNGRAMAGQEVRLINIPADAGRELSLFEDIHGLESSKAFSVALKELTTEHYGHAGPAFLEALTDQAASGEVLKQVEQEAQRFMKDHVPKEASGQVSRVADRFALVAGVGEAAIKRGLLPWPEGEAIDAARTCFHTWLNARGGITNLEASQAVAQVQRFLELHGDSRFTDWDGHDDRPTINRAGFRKKRLEGENVLTERTEYYVFPESFRTELCAGLSPREVTNVLMQQGLLLKGSDGKAQKSVRLPGIGSKRMYHISADIMGAVQEEAEPEPPDEQNDQAEAAVTRYSL